MDSKKEILIDALIRKHIALMELEAHGNEQSLEESERQLKDWVDLEDAKYADLNIKYLKLKVTQQVAKFTSNLGSIWPRIEGSHQAIEQFGYWRSQKGLTLKASVHDSRQTLQTTNWTLRKNLAGITGESTFNRGRIFVPILTILHSKNFEAMVSKFF